MNKLPQIHKTRQSRRALTLDAAGTAGDDRRAGVLSRRDAMLAVIAARIASRRRPWCDDPADVAEYAHAVVDKLIGAEGGRDA